MYTPYGIVFKSVMKILYKYKIIDYNITGTDIFESQMIFTNTCILQWPIAKEVLIEIESHSTKPYGPYTYMYM